MIGKLVAVRIDDLGDYMRVTGFVAQAKNRKRAWSILIPEDEQPTIPFKVIEQENARKGLSEV